MNGNDNIVQNSTDVAKKNLVKSQNNEIVCNHVENFENYNNINKKYNFNYIKNIILIIIIIILLFILFLI